MSIANRITINFCSHITLQSVSSLITVVQQGINNGAQEIRILMSSGGGDPNAALSAYNFLRGMPAKVITHNYGVCDSAAIIIFCAGENRLSCSHAKFLIHESRATIQDANANKLDEAIQQLRQIEDLQAEVISNNCDKNKTEIHDFMGGASAVLDASVAKSWGLVTALSNELLQSGEKAVVIGVPPAKGTP